MPRSTEFEGQHYVRRAGGWERAHPAEAEILRGDPRAVALKSAIADLYGLGNLVAGFSMNVIRARGMEVGDKQDALFADAVRNFDDSAQLRALRPGPAGQGGALIELAGLVPAARLARLATGRPAQRVRRALDPGGERLGTATDDAVDEAFTGSTVGAAQGAPVRGMGKFFRHMTDNLDAPRRLSADQFEILESGLWDEVGFEFPLMSLNNEQSYASILSNPLLNRDVLPSIFRNSKRLSDDFISAVGLDPADFPRGMGRGVLSAGRQHFKKAFGRTARELGDDIDLAAGGVNIDDIAPFLKREQRALVKQGEMIDGRQLMTLRSQLNNQALPGAWRTGDQITINVIEDSIEAIDDIITGRLSDDSLRAWRRTQEQWRTFMVTKRPGVVDLETGELSLKTLTRNLEKQYTDFFEAAPGELAALRFQNEATGELLKFARVARSFTDSIADSGTATRSLMSILANPKASMKFGVMRHSLDTISLTPQQALDLAR